MIADNTDTITETITDDTITFIVAGTVMKLGMSARRFPKSTETFFHVNDVTRRDQIILCDSRVTKDGS